MDLGTGRCRDTSGGKAVSRRPMDRSRELAVIPIWAWLLLWFVIAPWCLSPS
jgi:hypothetical protein